MTRAPAASIALAALLAAVVAVAADDDPVDAYVAALNGASGAGGAIEHALAPNFVDRSALLPADAAAFAGRLAVWRRAVPDLRVTVLERTRGPGVELVRLRYTGHLADAALAPASGRALAIESTERFEVTNGRLSARQASVDEWTLPTEWMFVPPPSLPYEPRPAEPVATLGRMRFPESVAFAPDGTLYVSLGPEGTIVARRADGALEPIAHLDVGPGGYVMCLAFDADGRLYTSAISSDAGVRGVWRIGRDRRPVRLAELPAGSAPNGIALDGRGHVLLADSFAGRIWRVPVDGGRAEAWLEHPWLAARPLVGRFPGANGLQRDGEPVVVAVSDRSLLLRIPIGSDGAAGAPRVLAGGLPADDFAVARDGTLYVTTHPFDSIVRVEPGGRQTVIAGPAQGIAGPISAAFGPDGALYVSTDGGLWRPRPDAPPVARIVRIRLTGAPAR